jgi:hypothetical protein
VIDEVVARAEAQFKEKRLALLDVRLPLQDVAAAYESEADFADAVTKAKALLKEIDDKLPRR